MSARAIQRLRKEREQELSAAAVRSDVHDESDGDEAQDNKVTGGFGGLMGDDSDSESSDNEDDSDVERKSSSEEIRNYPNDSEIRDTVSFSNRQHNTIPNAANEVDELPDKTDDLDTILEEFKSQDSHVETAGVASDQKNVSRFAIIMSGMDQRDLDIGHVNRTSLLGRTEPVSGTSNRRGRQAYIFGPPSDGWPRPPRYVGGGLGMTSYENEFHPLPWPYRDMKEGDDRCPGRERWFKFTQSDSYVRDCEDFVMVKNSGDPNTLALFVSHHPFVIEPLLQLSTLLYQINQAQEGLSFLKRALWVFECASLNSFLKVDGSASMMDFELAENERFFAVLFRLVRVSYVAG
jgi:Transcriptional repressor TCF25